ncbi:hypothetical protein L1887_35479 [Cichorium endivia]|nr:hypothetical protein L1887_35479 [Cichorium endivia]
MSVEEQVEKLNRDNEALMIRLDNVDVELCEKDRLLEEKGVALEAVEKDLKWVVEEGAARIVEKIFLIPEFMHGINRIRRTSYVAGEEAGRRGLRQELKIGGPDTGEGGSASECAREVDDAMEEFATLDYAGLLSLGELRVDGLKELLRVEADG